jgi:hypothetical protein
MGTEAAKVHLGSKRVVSRILQDLRRRKADWLFSDAKEMAKATEREWKKILKVLTRRVAPSPVTATRRATSCRSPSCVTVGVQRHSVVKNRVDNRSCSLCDRPRNEKYFFTVHGVRQQTFIRRRLQSYIKRGRLFGRSLAFCLHIEPMWEVRVPRTLRPLQRDHSQSAVAQITWTVGLSNTRMRPPQTAFVQVGFSSSFLFALIGAVKWSSAGVRRGSREMQLQRGQT